MQMWRSSALLAPKNLTGRSRWARWVDLGERQLLAKPIPLSLVAGGIDALREQKRFVQPVQLLLNRPDPSFLLRRPVFRFGPPLFPDVEDTVLHQAHVAGRRLQEREFVGERAFEHGLADVHRATLALAALERGSRSWRHRSETTS